MTHQTAQSAANSQLHESDIPGWENPAIAKVLCTNRWFQLFEIAIVFSPVLAVLVAFRMIGLENPMLLIGAIWIANLVMLGLIWLGIRIRGETWNSIGLSFEWTDLRTVGWTVLKSIPILLFAVFAFILGTIVMANIVGIPEGADMTKYNYLSGNLPMLLISLAGVYVVSSFGEEVVYRGFLMTRMQDLLGGQTKLALIGALILSSIVFGFAHFEWGPTGIVQTTCMGLALGTSFLWTKRRLWPLIVAHAIMDTMLLIPLYFET